MAVVLGFMFPKLPGFVMIRSVCSLVLTLLLCAASGCVAGGSGVSRRINLSDRSVWPNGASKTQAKVDKADSTGVATFKDLDRDSNSFGASGDSSFAGHVADQLSQTTTGKRSGEKGGSGVVPADFQQESAPKADQAIRWSDEPADPNVTDAHFRSDRDGTDNPVELQGLQIVEPPDVGGGENLVSPSVDSARANAAQALRPSLDAGARSLTSANHTAAATTGPWQAELEHLIARAEQELSATSPTDDPDEYRRRQVHLRLLYLVARHPEQALTAIPAMDPADQEYWQQLVWAITNSVDADNLSPRERAAQTIPPVNTALRRLREQADLTIRNAGFCEEISYFGNYKRFPKEEFVPGQPVLLYAEIENFRSEPSQSGEYRTLLRSLIEIVGANGQIRWKKSFAATEDLCRNPRRDYFHNYQFTIPERLPMGPHTLKLTVVDELSGKQATCALKFMVK